MLSYDENTRASFSELKELIVKLDTMMLFELGGFGDGKMDPNEVVTNQTNNLQQSVIKAIPEQPNATYA